VTQRVSCYVVCVRSLFSLISCKSKRLVYVIQLNGIEFESIPTDYLIFRQTKHIKCVGLFTFSSVTLDKMFG